MDVALGLVWGEMLHFNEHGEPITKEEYENQCQKAKPIARIKSVNRETKVITIEAI
jgi:hypothetical protein